MLTTVPFAGFYNTIHDSELDHQLEQSFADHETGCHPNEALVQRAFDLIDWKAVQTKYAEAYCENLAIEFKIDMKFESMDSPKFYNFTTDRVFATISEKEAKRLRAATDEKMLRDVARENFTSRDGFCSSYSNDVDDWGPLETWDHNQLGTLLTAYIRQEHDGEFDSWAEYALMEDEFSNGAFDNWVSETSPKIKRLWDIWYYLDCTRKERHSAQL